MVSFFIRSGIVLIAIIIAIGFANGLRVDSFMIACMFVCAWITVVTFKNIFWWIMGFSIIFGLVHYDMLVIYIVSMLGVAILFDLAYSYVRRSANDNFITLYAMAFVFTSVAMTLMEFIMYRYVFISVTTTIINIVVTLCLFIVFRFLIKRAERFINLYTHGTDMRCHT